MVKGPLVSAEAGQNALEVAAWKAAMGLPFVPVGCVEMIPDRWPEGVALGLRNTIARDRPATFLVSRSLLREVDLKRRVHSSATWPPTEVFDDTHVHLHLQFERLTPVEMEDYVKALLFRWVFGINDLADRNFLRSGKGRIISVDEEARDRPVNFMAALPSHKRCAAIAAWVDGHHASMHLDAWKFSTREYTERGARLVEKAFVLALFRPP